MNTENDGHELQGRGSSLNRGRITDNSAYNSVDHNTVRHSVIQQNQNVNNVMHNWTRRHFWLLHLLTFLLAVSCSWSVLFWINSRSGISKKYDYNEKTF